MNPQQQLRYEALRDAYTAIGIARGKAASGPMNVWKFLDDAQKHVEKQMDAMAAPILADDFFECGCGEEIAVGDDHQCAYIEACAQEDEQSRNYAQRTM